VSVEHSGGHRDDSYHNNCTGEQSAAPAALQGRHWVTHAFVPVDTSGRTRRRGYRSGWL
jgi:hypothetical protein